MYLKWANATIFYIYNLTLIIYFYQLCNHSRYSNENIFVTNKNVDIEISAHDAFLE